MAICFSDLNFILDELDTREGWNKQYPDDCENVVPVKEEVMNECGRLRHMFLPPSLPSNKAGRPKMKRFAVNFKPSSGQKRKSSAVDSEQNSAEKETGSTAKRAKRSK